MLQTGIRGILGRRSVRPREKSMRDADIRRLEEIGARTWPALSAEWLGGWLLSLDRGLTRRANSVLPMDWTGDRPIDRQIDEAEGRYLAHGLAPCFKMTRAARPADLDSALDRRGYTLEGQSLVLTAEPSSIEAPDGPDIGLFTDATPAWLGSHRQGHGDDDRWLDIVRRISGPRAFVLARIGGDCAGTALASIDGGWTCITAVHTAPAFRRRGVARALVGALAAWARPLGGGLFLQVEADNDPALRLYASAGFQPAYDYHYRTLRT